MTATTAGADPGAGRAHWWATYTGRPRQRLHPRLAPLLFVLGVSWVLVIFTHVTGSGHEFTHHHFQHANLTTLLTVVLAWQLMTLAMMGPSFLPAARYVAMNTLQPARTVVAFLVGYLLLWSGFLATAAVGDVTLHSVTGHDGWLAQHNTLLPAAILLAAAVWQLIPLKRACLLSCRTGRVLPAKGHRADLGAVTFGVRHGLACVGSCGPMMLVMLAVNSWHLLWMAVLGVVIWLEKTRGIGRRLAHPTAAGFTALAVLVFLWA
jgi:predicted metal-binding membrane protein